MIDDGALVGMQSQAMVPIKSEDAEGQPHRHEKNRRQRRLDE